MPPPATGLILESSKLLGEMAMGKYFLAWMLGVPASVLIVIFLIFR